MKSSSLQFFKLSIAGILSAILVLLMVSTVVSIPSTFASQLSTPMPAQSRWGIHLGNHVANEAWSPALLERIDGDNGGTWPDTLVALSSNLYDRPRNTSTDCKIGEISASAGMPLDYLQRAAAAGVKIIIRIWPSPGNFITPTHRLDFSNEPFNGNRCDDGSVYGQRGNRSYDDVGDEIVKIHEWNISHGIPESGFIPANEPNAEWYAFDTLIRRDDPLAWSDMDIYFSAIYTYVHSISTSHPITVLTPPMAQETYAEVVDFNGCIDRGFHGYEHMPRIFLYGFNNDGYTWNNYWNIGYEASVPSCRPDVIPHGHHVSFWFPGVMNDNMANKPSYILEADLKSPGEPQHGDLMHKDDQSGLTASGSISQFLNAEEFASHIAVWALNITNAGEVEQNWHEAYACNDFNWLNPPATKGPIERPWFTRWWAGETPSYSVAACYRFFLPAGLKHYPEELIQNGHFDAGAAYWNVWRSTCSSPIVTNFMTTTNQVASLGACNNNSDSISQTVTIPVSATSAYLSFQYYIQRPLAVPHPINCNESYPPLYGDCLFVEMVDVATGQTQRLTTHNDNETGWIWQTNGFNLLSYSGHTIKIQFRARTDQNYAATFFVDDVSLVVTR